MRNGIYNFTIPGNPVAKPRMSQRDKWQQRPCVVKYRAWADMARLAAPRLPDEPESVHMIAYLSMPKHWSKAKQARMAGTPHRVKPDADNIAKAGIDSLFKNDAMIWDVHLIKRWEDSEGARLEVTVK